MFPHTWSYIWGNIWYIHHRVQFICSILSSYWKTRRFDLLLLLITLGIKYLEIQVLLSFFPHHSLTVRFKPCNRANASMNSKFHYPMALIKFPKLLEINETFLLFVRGRCINKMCRSIRESSSFMSFRQFYASLWGKSSCFPTVRWCLHELIAFIFSHNMYF